MNATLVDDVTGCYDPVMSDLHPMDPEFRINTSPILKNPPGWSDILVRVALYDLTSAVVMINEAEHALLTHSALPADGRARLLAELAKIEGAASELASNIEALPTVEGALDPKPVPPVAYLETKRSL
jgi:hypothetical protein